MDKSFAGGRDRGYYDDYYMGEFHLTKLIKVGDSLGIVIPKNILRAYGWERGDTIAFVFASDDLLGVRRVSEKEMRILKGESTIIDIESNTERTS